MADLWCGFPDYYGVLRVAPDASDVEVRDAWRAAAKRWHPDTTRERDAAAMMRRVNEAWQVLGDRDARAVYDEVYFAWRTGSEQLAVELSGMLDMQRERRQARAGSAEWGRWGREDRGRWGREGEEHGRAGDARERTGTAGARAGGGERDARANGTRDRDARAERSGGGEARQGESQTSYGNGEDAGKPRWPTDLVVLFWGSIGLVGIFIALIVLASQA